MTNKLFFFPSVFFLLSINKNSSNITSKNRKMVHIYRGDIVHKLHALQPGKRMPLLCSVNKSFGWRIISENHEE